MSKYKMLMFVYGDLNRDARVQRSLDALQDSFDITIATIGTPNRNGKYRNIVLNQQKPVKKTGFAGRLLDYFRTIYRLCQYVNRNHFDVAYMHDYYAAIPALMIKKKGISVIYDEHEFFIVPKGEKRELNAHEIFFGYFENRLMKKADFIITTNIPKAKLLVEHFQLDKVPFVVPNYSELPTVDKYNMSFRLRQFFEGDDRKIIVYAGGLNSERHLEVIIRAVAQEYKKYKLLMIGDGPYRNIFENECLKYPNLTYYFTGNIPYKFLGNILKRCFAGYVSVPNSPFHLKYCSPNKIHEYSSVKLPMICNENTTLYNEVCLNNIGVCVTDNDEWIKNKKNTYASMSEALIEIERNYEKYVANMYAYREKKSWQKFKPEYEKVINNFVNSTLG